MIKLSHPTRQIEGIVNLPFSKSILNRLLVLKHLYFPNLLIPAYNLANDSFVLQGMLEQVNINRSGILDAKDAGTAYRFMQAVLCIQGGNFTLTGTEKLRSRPSEPLIQSLHDIGFNIFHSTNSISIQTKGAEDVSSLTWEIDVSQSSQFASALLLIAPKVGHEVVINLIGEAVSTTYLQMTIDLMLLCGFDIKVMNSTISVAPCIPAINNQIEIDPEYDWSSASYFFGIAALSESFDLKLKHLSLKSIQPDKGILELDQLLGIAVKEDDTGLRLLPSNLPSETNSIIRDYTNMPDIALTEIVVCFAKGIKLQALGTAHLAYKESDRLVNINRELEKFHRSLLPTFETYADHRMAMSLSMLALLKPIVIKNESVVDKSFPNYWDELRTLGFIIESI